MMQEVVDELKDLGADVVTTVERFKEDTSEPFRLCACTSHLSAFSSLAYPAWCGADKCRQSRLDANCLTP